MSTFTKYTIVALFSFLTGIFLSLKFGYIIPLPTKNEISKNTPNIILRDTIFTIRESKPLIISKVKTKIRYVSDSTLTTKPFSATVDTIIRHDTIHTRFDFPSNSFSLEIRKKPDTVFAERTIVLPLPEDKEKWWTKPACVAGGVVLGILIKSITK